MNGCDEVSFLTTVKGFLRLLELGQLERNQHDVRHVARHPLASSTVEYAPMLWTHCYRLVDIDWLRAKGADQTPMWSHEVE
jgi:hypothetical protein